MKVPFIIFAATTFLSLRVCSSAQEFFSVFKASISIPAEKVQINQFPVPDKVLTMTITSKEFVNLSLGRPIDQALDPQHEIFALAVAFDSPTDPGTHTPDLTPNSKFILWDPNPAVGNPNVVKVLAKINNLDYDEVSLSAGWKGQGLGEISISEGTDPNNKFFATTLNFAARGTTPDPTEINLIKKITIKLTGLSGRMHFMFKKANPATSPLTDWWSFALKGTITTVGTRIGNFQE